MPFTHFLHPSSSISAITYLFSVSVSMACLFYISHIHPLTYWCTPILLLYLGYCEKFCPEHDGVHISFQVSVLTFFEQIPRNGIAGHIIVLFLFFKEPPNYFPYWLHQLTSLPTEYKGSLCSASLPTLITYRHFDDHNSDRCEVISHWDFDFQFPDN